MTAVGTWTGVGLCAQELVASGQRCDPVPQYTPSVVLFLALYDRGSFAALRTVPGFQVFVWQVLSQSTNLRQSPPCRTICPLTLDAQAVNVPQSQN